MYRNLSAVRRRCLQWSGSVNPSVVTQSSSIRLSSSLIQTHYPPKIRKFNLNLRLRLISSLPSHKIVPMPSLSPTMESGSISKWNLKEGERFEAGTALCDVETDKATVSFDATEEGYIAKILIGTGEVKVGQPIMVTVEEAADVTSFSSFQLDTQTASSIPAKIPTNVSPSIPLTSTSNSPSRVIPATRKENLSDRIFASPLARKLVRESKSNLEAIHSALGGIGSGLNNRIVSADVLKGLSVIASQPIKREFLSPSSIQSDQPAKPATTLSTKTSSAASSTTGPFADFELTQSARDLASRLAQNKQNIPHYYVSVEINLAELLKVRDLFNQQLRGKKAATGGSTSPELSVMDFLVKAAGLAITQVPDVNASWGDTFVRRYDQVDINVVIGSGNILATPVLRNVNGRGLLSIAEEIDHFEHSLFSSDKTVVDQFLQDEVKHGLGTFTIHNLGSFGIKSAAPIVLSSQSCALALGAIHEVVLPIRKVEENGKEWEIAPVIVATLSCDHRVVDGAISAQYLSAFKQLAENPWNLLL